MKRTVVFSVLSALLALILLASIPAFADTPFVKEVTNPVLIGLTGWESGGASTGTVIWDPLEGLYKQWYSGIDDNDFVQIGYATSPDGIIWTQYDENPIITYGAPGSWDSRVVGGPSVIREAWNSYKMWYTGASTTSYPISSIGYATSTDGIVWVKHGIAPVLEVGSTGEWDDEGVLDPCVIKESATSYKMWFTGRDDSDNSTLGIMAIGYATSTDGINWNKEVSNPIMQGSYGFDDRGVGGAYVVKQSPTYYIMYYTGFETGGLLSEIGRAVSGDGLSWGGREQVLAVGSPESWEEEGVGDPTIIISGNSIMMWYTGTTTEYRTQIGLARAQINTPPGVPASSSAATLFTITGFALLIGGFVLYKKSRLSQTLK
jgi:predicted GH43/DUF377 family glycosyl hydrolase